METRANLDNRLCYPDLRGGREGGTLEKGGKKRKEIRFEV